MQSMSKKSLLLLQVLEQINSALLTVMQRFVPVTSVSVFTDTPEGTEKLDAICMQLIAIGESLKKVDKLTDKKLLTQYDNIDWTGAKGVRDIIAHHYFEIDAEDIYEICSVHVGPMQKVIEQLVEQVQAQV